MAPTTPSVGRNEPCPCGSGRKYKHCCLDKDEAKARKARARDAEKAAKEAEKARTAAEEGAADYGRKESAGGDKVAAPRPNRPQTFQPWKKSATNTHAFQRMSTPRKVGGS